MNALTQGGLPEGTVTSKVAPAPRARASSGTLSLFQGAYHAGSSGTQELAGWHPSLRSPDAEMLPSRDKVVARARDLDRNNGWIAGAIDKKADAIVGSNIRLRARPDFAAMGMSAEWADEWSTRVEALFRTWSRDSRFLCDVERHQQFGGLVRLAYIHWARDGDAAAPIFWLERGGAFSTSVLVLDPDRLSNPDGKPDGRWVNGVDYRGGVELDRNGAAVAYHVRDAHPSDVGGDFSGHRWTRIPRETGTGRPLFVHAFNKRRAHQHRALSALASTMVPMRMLDRYGTYELGAAMMQQVFGMYVESPFDSDFVREALAPAEDEDATLSGYQALRAAYHESADVSINGVRLAHLMPGEKIATVEARHPHSNYKDFNEYQLGHVASPLGLAREQMTGNWAGINYSNARTLLNETWRGWHSERWSFTQSFCTPIFASWLEEAVARDLVEVPGGKAMFYVFRSALTQCEWLGPARGTIDKLKEGKGDEIDRDGMVSTLEAQCAERGLDWRDVLWQRKREMEEMRRYGLLPDEAATGNAGGGDDTNAGAEDDDPDAADRRETAGEDA